MKKQRTSKLAETLRMTAALFLMLMLGAIYPAAVSEVKAQSQSKAPASSRGGPQEGLKVHGHWTIEVRNPDGNLVTRREFENALTPSGASMLSVVLSRVYQAGKWAIGIGGACLQEDGNDFPNCVPYKTLSISSEPGKMTLKASVTLNKDVIINNVRTMNWICKSTSTPEDCIAHPEVAEFTSHDLLPGSDTPPVNVADGQSVQITVTISFS